MKDDRKACEKCGTLVPAGFLYTATTLRYGLVCGGCFYELKRTDEARQIKATWRRAFVDMFWTDHVMIMMSFVIFLIVAALDKAGYINIFGR